jgi:hypothetical protein
MKIKQEPNVYTLTSKPFNKMLVGGNEEDANTEATIPPAAPSSPPTEN